MTPKRMTLAAGVVLTVDGPYVRNALAGIVDNVDLSRYVL